MSEEEIMQKMRSDGFTFIEETSGYKFYRKKETAEQKFKNTITDMKKAIRYMGVNETLQKVK